MLAMFNKPSVFYLFLLNRNLCLNHGPIQFCCCLLIGKINLLGITILILKPAFIIKSPLLVRWEGEEAFLPPAGEPGSVSAKPCAATVTHPSCGHPCQNPNAARTDAHALLGFLGGHISDVWHAPHNQPWRLVAAMPFKSLCIPAVASLRCRSHGMEGCGEGTWPSLPAGQRPQPALAPNSWLSAVHTVLILPGCVCATGSQLTPRGGGYSRAPTGEHRAVLGIKSLPFLSTGVCVCVRVSLGYFLCCHDFFNVSSALLCWASSPCLSRAPGLAREKGLGLLLLPY